MGEIKKRSVLERKIDKAIENNNEIELIRTYFQYITKRGERTTRNFIRFTDDILDNYNFYRQVYSNYPDKYNKFFAIFNKLK